MTQRGRGLTPRSTPTRSGRRCKAGLRYFVLCSHPSLTAPTSAGGVTSNVRPHTNALPIDRPMNTVIVRQAVLADLETLAGLFDQYRQFQGKPANLSACRDFLRDRFNHAQSAVFLANIDTEPVGFAQLYPSFSSTALARVFILNDLFVAESGRRCGVASALLAAVEEYAWSFGACRVSLNVAQVNVSAQDLYEAKAWVRDAEFFMYHRYPPKP
jgi:GNAT superfamily N-acetyltransferase